MRKKGNVFHNLLLARVRSAGGTPGDFNYAADVLNLAAREANGWTNRADDALRIPDMLSDAARFLRRCCEEDDLK